MIKKLLIVLIVLIVGAPLVFWLGAYASLDHDRNHTRASEALAEFDPENSSTNAVTLSKIRVDNLWFRVRSAGFGGTRGNVILLHGFPESSAMWAPMIPVLAENGYQVVAFDQRGYSPGARPTEVSSYGGEQLAGDVFAVADAVGFENFHLVGHDWGAGVGWMIVLTDPDRLQTWTSLSIPHLVAYGEAIQSDPDQQSRSAYIGFFQMPWLAETVFTFNRLQILKDTVYAEHHAEIIDEYLAIFSEPGAMTAALNWYRASGGLSQDDLDPMVNLPVLFIWGSDDPVVGDTALEVQRQYFNAPFTELELDTGHWLMETKADTVTAAVLNHLDTHSRGR